MVLLLIVKGFFFSDSAPVWYAAVDEPALCGEQHGTPVHGSTEDTAGTTTSH
jgi:hypothetical protein